MIQNISSEKINLIIDISLRAGLYTFLIFSYWFGFNKLSHFLKKKVKNCGLLGTINVVLVIFAVGLSISTLVLAFVDNLAVFFGSLSLLSAAFVFALQDFVSCFFAWIYIELTKQYRLNDLIQIQTQNGNVSGWISEIGLFRSQIRERVGGDGIDRERPTGRTVTFPNNYIFKYALANQTKNHLILWHNLDIVITFESDYVLAQKVLKKALEDKFEDLILHPDKYFQNGIGELHNFMPKIYTSINENGVCFSIWFGARAGYLREILQEYSLEILKTIRENNITLAYKTSRIIKDEK